MGEGQGPCPFPSAIGAFKGRLFEARAVFWSREPLLSLWWVHSQTGRKVGWPTFRFTPLITALSYSSLCAPPWAHHQPPVGMQLIWKRHCWFSAPPSSKTWPDRSCNSTFWCSKTAGATSPWWISAAKLGARWCLNREGTLWVGSQKKLVGWFKIQWMNSCYRSPEHLLTLLSLVGRFKVQIQPKNNFSTLAMCPAMSHWLNASG